MDDIPTECGWGFYRFGAQVREPKNELCRLFYNATIEECGIGQGQTETGSEAALLGKADPS